MAALTVFWTPEESAPWLSRMAEKYGLQLRVFPPYPDNRKPFTATPPFSSEIVRNASYIFFAPKGDKRGTDATKLKDVDMLGWGWGCVRFGGRFDEPLPLLEQCEVIARNRASVPLKLEKCVTWLKRQLENDSHFKRGVRISWTHLPGKTRTDNDYLWSEGARNLLEEGVAWVASRGSSTIRFEPK